MMRSGKSDVVVIVSRIGDGAMAGALCPPATDGSILSERPRKGQGSITVFISECFQLEAVAGKTDS